MAEEKAAGAPALDTNIETGGFDEKRGQAPPPTHAPKAPVAEDEEPDEDMDALIEDLESEDGHAFDEEEETQPGGGREDPTGAAAIARATLNEATGKRARRKGGKVDDPWEELKKKRAEAKIAVHDQAQAPPELNKNMTKQIKIKDTTANVGNIPKTAGSLKRREELQEARADVLEAYRKIREHEQAKLLKAGL